LNRKLGVAFAIQLYDKSFLARDASYRRILVTA
jgi:hypothetical protein